MFFPTLGALVFILTGCAGSGSGDKSPQAGSVRFELSDLGRPPRNFTTALTGEGGPPEWAVRQDASAPDGNLVVVQESAEPVNYRFSLCIYDQLVARDVAVEVKFKALSGTLDQAGGIVLRYRPGNYYIARANALENNVILFKTVNGQRSKIKEVPTRVTRAEWHTLRFSAHGPLLTIALNGRVVLEQHDDTFTGAGNVGLWTKADSITEFTDFRIQPVASTSTAVRQAGAFLAMPESSKGLFPRLLSQTGAFVDTARLRTSDGLLPYDLIVPFWSDGAAKQRWMALPNEGCIGFNPTGEWTFPQGTVFVKHFELPIDETRPQLRRRLETRLLVCDTNGGVYGVSYKWRADNSDAELLSSNLLESIPVRTRSGIRTQTWYYPSQRDCLECHTKNAGLVLGVKTRQLNRDFRFPSGRKENLLSAWNRSGVFNSNLDDAMLAGCKKLAGADDITRTLEDRARSYLDANCANCHRPGGTVAFFDARYDTPLVKQGLVGGSVLLDEGLDGARAIAPHDVSRSIIFLRVTNTDALKMPPLAHQVVDRKGETLLRGWINSLPGPPVVPPPTLFPSGGDYTQPVTIRIQEEEPGAIVHYTLDGSRPTSEDPIFPPTLTLTNTVTVRARAFKPGFTKSIPSQETYVLNYPSTRPSR